MNTKYFFPPVHMLGVVQKMKQLTQSSSEAETQKAAANEENLQFIEAISRLSIEEARQQAYVLSLRQLRAIAFYLCNNRAHLNTKPLMQVLSERKNTALFQTIFDLWKANYQSEDLCGILESYIDEQDNDTANTRCPIDLQTWTRWKNTDGGFAVGLAKELYAASADDGALDKYRIFRGDNIWYGAKRAIILVCSSEAYTHMSADDVEKTLRMYDQSKQRLFLDNFLQPMPDVKTQFAYKPVCVFFENQYPAEGRKSQFWDEVSEDTKGNFKKWSLRLCITAFFGDDDRSRFWVKMLDSMENAYVVKDNADRCQIAMLFETFAVIDFTVTGFAARIVSRLDFDRYLSVNFIGSNKLSNDAMRTRISTNMASERIVHKSGWENMAYNNIYRKLGVKLRYGSKVAG